MGQGTVLQLAGTTWKSFLCLENSLSMYRRLVSEWGCVLEPRECAVARCWEWGRCCSLLAPWPEGLVSAAVPRALCTASSVGPGLAPAAGDELGAPRGKGARPWPEPYSDVPKLLLLPRLLLAH